MCGGGIILWQLCNQGTALALSNRCGHPITSNCIPLAACCEQLFGSRLLTNSRVPGAGANKTRAPGAGA
jgi:hypothetical protein